MKFPRRRFLVLAAGAVALPAVSRIARAQAYPTRPVRMIIPFSAGSASDILARTLASKLSEIWGQPVVVENRPGAGTTLGTDVVAKAAPDGHTLLINSAAFAASAAIYPKLPYDPLADFAPVSQIAIAPIVVVVAPSLGSKSIKDLVEHAKGQAGQTSFGSSGVGSSTHFAGEQFKLAAGLNVLHIPYKGPFEALVDTMAGRIQYSFSPVLSQVPTVAEAGVPGYEYQDWWGAFAPAKTPRAVIDKIGKDIARVLEPADVVKRMLDQGTEAKPSTPDVFTDFVRAKIEAARKLATLSGIRA